MDITADITADGSLHRALPPSARSLILVASRRCCRIFRCCGWKPDESTLRRGRSGGVVGGRPWDGKAAHLQGHALLGTHL